MNDLIGQGVFSASCMGALSGCRGQRIAGPARRVGRKRCVIMGLRANGHNTTNNNQQPSKHPAHKTRPGQESSLSVLGRR